MTHAEACEAARRECSAAHERARREGRAKSIEQVVREVYASRVRRTGVSSSRAPVRTRTDAEELKAQLAYVRSFEPILVPEAREPAPAVRRVRYWVGNSRLGAIREVVVNEPPARDRWGRPTR